MLNKNALMKNIRVYMFGDTNPFCAEVLLKIASDKKKKIGTGMTIITLISSCLTMIESNV